MTIYKELVKYKADLNNYNKIIIENLTISFVEIK